jgi:hypothetical protein
MSMANQIYKAITEIMGEVGVIGKDRTNKQQGFKYRGVEDVMNVLQPLLKKYGVFIVPEVVESTREERSTKSGGNLIYSVMKIRHHFYAEDGSEVVSTTIGEGMDSADKASNKAMSIAFKYACFQVFCIPTEEMIDPDGETPPQSTNEQPQNTHKTPPKTNDKPKVVETITRSELIQKYGVSNPEKTITWLEGYFGKEIGKLTEEETKEAREILDEKKRQKDEEKRKAALERVSDEDIPFPLGDE